MEFSEQCVDDSVLDPEDLRTEERVIEDINPETLSIRQGENDQGEEVIAYLDLQDTEQARLILQPQGINFDGRHFYIQQDGEGGEIYVMVQQSSEQDQEEQVTEEPVVPILGDVMNHELDNQGESMQVGNIETEEISHEIGNSEAVYIEQKCELPYEISYNIPVENLEGVKYHVPLKEDSTEMDFSPTTSDPHTSTVIPAEGSKHGKLLHLAVVAQKLQSADVNSSEHIQDLSCSQGMTDGSVIVSQIHPDIDSVSVSRASETEEDTATDLASEHDSKGSTCEGTSDRELEVKSPVVDRKTSFSCISTARTIDNTVSVIHTTSSTYVHDDSVKDVESSYISEDYNVKQKLDIDIAEGEKLEDSLPVLPANLTHVTHDNCSNINDKFSNQDEDSALSQNFGLDLTKESKIDLPCDEDSSLAVEPPRGGYGIMDSLNKEKRNSYYDTNASDEIEDTINSSSISTNGTEDAESISENNSSEMECNNEKIASERNLSNEALTAENGNTTLKHDINAIKASGESSRESSRDSKINKASKPANKVSSRKRNLRSSFLSNSILPTKDNTNSKSSVFSNENISSPAKGVSSVKKNGKLNRKNKKTIDTYEFEDNSVNEDKDSNHGLHECQLSEASEDGTNNPKVSENKTSLSTDPDEGEKALKLTFRGALSSVLDKKENISKITRSDSIESNKSADLFDHATDEEDNGNQDFVIPDNQEEKNSNLENAISEPEDLNGNKNVFLENGNTQKVFDEPCSRKENDVPDLVTTEENSVKPPQKTYIRKKKLNIQDENQINDKQKIELFSCDDLSSTKDSETPLVGDTQKDSDIVWKGQVDELEIDDMESNVKSKVSYTYKRKRKSVPQVVRAKRTQSLRPRSSLECDSQENGTVETSISEIQERLISQEKLDSDSVRWGNCLLETTFSSKTSVSDIPKVASTTSKNSQSFRKRNRPAWFTTGNSKKNQLASGKQFDRLIKSSPPKVKGHVSKERKLREKVKKQANKLLNKPKNFNNLLNSSLYVHKQGRPKKSECTVPKSKPIASPVAKTGVLKKSGIKYFPQTNQSFDYLNTVNESSPVNSNEESASVNNNEQSPPVYSHEESTPTNSQEQMMEFPCVHCNFVSKMVNNLIMHLKFCSSKQSALKFEYKCDMDKRQRIRGEDKCDKTEVEERSKGRKTGSSMDCQDVQPGCSTFRESPFTGDDETNDKADSIKEKYGFAENDIVWVKHGKKYWPALIGKLDEKEVLLHVISTPDATEVLKIGTESLQEYLHTFEDVAFNQKKLDEAKRCNLEDYIQCVQKATYFNVKKLIGEKIDAKQFFNLEDSVDRSYEINESMDTSDSTYLRNNDIEEVDISEVMKCIYQGQCDEHVVLIQKGEVKSERHDMHQSNDTETTKRLEDMSWFGPFKTDSSMQLQLYSHFYKLYKKHVPGEPNISYIYKVWIPEGIIKAISLVNDTSFDEAEIIFLKQELKTGLLYDHEVDILP